MNPNSRDRSRDWMGGNVVSIEGGEVTRVPSHTQGDDVGHVIEVVPDRSESNEPETMAVGVDQHGDVTMPEEGDRVLIAYYIGDEEPIVIGARYEVKDNIPDFEPGERVVGHPASDSYIRLRRDGSVQVDGHNGNSIELQENGDVVLNDGDTRPVTQVDFTNEVIARATDVYVPSP